MNARKMVENIRSISLLSVISLLVSAAFITIALFLGSKWLGYEIPIEVALLFAALISATDPVAVLALFKEYGAPKRLSLIFEGESLFNDGTSLALFLIILEILLSGWHGMSSLGLGIFMFTTMVIGGIFFGGLMGAIFSKIIEHVRDNEHVEITLTMIVAHFTFIFSEILSHHLHLFGQDIKFSSIIATVVAAMVVGNYGRYKISPRVEEYMEKFWGYFAFLTNSIVFILIGLLFASLEVPLRTLAIPLTVAIVVVMIGRALSIYPIVGFLNWTKTEAYIPMSWQHLLAWGSLRGALAVTMVLLIPDDFSIANWPFVDISVKDYVTALTIACIYFTLFIKATTIGPLIKHLKIDALSPVEEIEREEGKALVYARVLPEIDRFMRKGYITEELHHALRNKYDALYHESCESYARATGETAGISERMLTIYATGVEKAYLKVLFFYKEIDETVYKKILHQLNLRLEYAEDINENAEIRMSDFKKDWLDKLSETTAKIFFGFIKLPPESVRLFMYYRARAVIAHKVMEELKYLSESGVKIFRDKEVFDMLLARYKEVEIWALEHTKKIQATDPKRISALAQRFAEAGIYKAEERILGDLYEKESLSAKAHILLVNELEARTRVVAEPSTV
jgi:CPA1 family monovalent cation:H+ antiporter